MSFTNNIFLIGLLPWFIILVYLARNKKYFKKILVFLANVIFYIYGGIGEFTFICAFSVIVWLFSKLVFLGASNQGKRFRVLFGVLVGLTLAPLLAIKYTEFLVENINAAFGCSVNAPNIVVPIGISFFTFEAVSLLCDIRSGKIGGGIDGTERSGEPSLSDVFMYLTFFPTVTSGPIVRYKDFKEGMEGTADTAAYGGAIERIVIGLIKKTLIADKLAPLADYYFDGVAAGNTYSCVGLLIGSIAFTLQLYFDFSGYSDMAIGIGKLIGFDICENFNRPYDAANISEFWRRWHISLSSWFRDYVYIPLGGSWCSAVRNVFNIFCVWILTGIWHGADWSFVLWGMGYFILIAAEKHIAALKNIGKHWYGHVYTLAFVNLLWIPFRADDLQTAFKYVTGMFDFGSIGALEQKAVSFLPFIMFTVILCLPWRRWLERVRDNRILAALKGITLILLTFLAICAVVNSSYTPYIYGKF